MGSINISEREVDKLAELSYIRISDLSEKKKLADDFKKILSYFEELKEVDTSGVSSVVGGSAGKNVWRGDEEKDLFLEEYVREGFPESKNGFLKIPPVFD